MNEATDIWKSSQKVATYQKTPDGCGNHEFGGQQIIQFGILMGYSIHWRFFFRFKDVTQTSRCQEFTADVFYQLYMSLGVSASIAWPVFKWSHPPPDLRNEPIWSFFAMDNNQPTSKHLILGDYQRLTMILWTCSTCGSAHFVWSK